MLDFHQIPFDISNKQAANAYHLLGMGLTKGVFQLEEHLGQRYAQIVKPKNILDIADIVSIIRPGSRNSMHVDGTTSMTDAYCKIRDGKMEPNYLHEDLKPILGPTNSVLVYQEQIIEICRHIAGMSLKDGDMVRKAMGKKLPEEMEKWHSVFVEGCLESGYDIELAKKLWEWIDKASGYLFNKSHAVAYATIAFKTAYAKANYPVQFYSAMLKYASSKTDTYEEMLDLINDAKLFKIAVIPPKISQAESCFSILNGHTIAYGIQYIKGVGSAAIDAILRTTSACIWTDFLVATERYKVKKDNVEALIKTGTLDEFDMPRTQMLAQYDMFRALTKNEKAIVLSLVSKTLHPNILIDIDGSDFEQKRTQTKYKKLAKTGIFLRCGLYGPVSDLELPDVVPPKMGPEHHVGVLRGIIALLQAEIPNSSRREKLSDMVEEYSNRTYHMDPALNVLWEKFYFGIPLTQSEAHNIKADPDTLSCIETYNVRPMDHIKLAGLIEDVTVKLTKRGNSAGKPLAFVDLVDNTYMLRGIVCFAEQYEKYADILKRGNAVCIIAQKMRDGTSIMVEKVRKL